MSHCTAPPDVSASTPAESTPDSLTPIEAEVYHQTALDVFQRREIDEEPSAADCADLAQMFARLTRLQGASERREEIHDPFVLPWLERSLPRLHEWRAEGEASSVDESKMIGEVGELIVACEDLIERARAYEPPRCESCGRPATHRENGRHDELHCERCARYSHAHDLGVAFAIGEMIHQFADAARGTGIDPGELPDAFQAHAEGREAPVGALRRVWLGREREIDQGVRTEDMLNEVDAWQRDWTPIEGAAEMAQ